MAFPHGAVGWSAVHNCVFSWSYSLTFWDDLHQAKGKITSQFEGEITFRLFISGGLTYPTTLMDWVGLQFVICYFLIILTYFF